MKRRVFKQRKDGIRQRYWVGKQARLKKFKMGWAKGVDNTDPNFMDGMWDDEPVYEKRRVLMDPDEFLHRQYEQSGERVSYEDWLRVNQKRVDEIKEAILDKNIELPVPLEEYTPFGERKDFQEGRHRGLAAKQLGVKVPVIQGRKKFAPWDRVSDDNPFEHKEAFYFTKPDKVDNRWDREKGKFELDTE
jgi:hypothetical protein